MKTNIFRIALLVLLGGWLGMSSALATHFRFSHITWRRVSPGSRTVAISVTEAWRTTFIDSLNVDFGDGSGGFSTSGAGRTTVGTFRDVAGEQYTVFTVTVNHTYTSDGPFSLTGDNCCRISSLVNAGDESFLYRTVVDLRNGNLGSPVSSIPIIVQVPLGLNTIPIPVADPDGDPVTLRFATGNESGIFTLPVAGPNPPIALDSNGNLVWNTTGGRVGAKYALQVVLEENHQGALGAVPLDFLLELVGANANLPPTCSGTSGNHVIEVGATFVANITGVDPEGLPLTVNTIGLPPGASVSPASGTTVASPALVSFSWTPTLADLGSSHAVTTIFTDSARQTCNCAFTVTVPNNVPPQLVCPGDIVLGAPGNHQLQFEVSDADGDELQYSIRVDGNVEAGGTIPAGGPPSGSLILFDFNYGPGPHTVEFQVSDRFFSRGCRGTSVTVPSAGSPPTVSNTSTRIASGKIATLQATDDTDPDPEIYITDSATPGFLAGPYHKGDRVIIRKNTRNPPEAKSQAGFSARIRVRGTAMLHAVDKDGNASAPIPCN